MRQNNIIPAEAGGIKLIVCDLDGTLLNSQKIISPASLKAIHAAEERGIFVTICTGRIPEMMEAYSRVLGIQGPYIAVNGAVIIDTRDNSMPFRSFIDSKETMQVLEFCAQQGFDHIAATTGGCYYSKGSKRIEKFEQYNEIADKNNLKQIPLYPFDPDYSKIADMNVYKLLISGLSIQQQCETEKYIGEMSHLSHTSSEPQLLDAVAAGVDKGTGIQNLARIMGVSKEEICVFGDYHNDLPMIEAAGFSVAMGNGDDDIKNKSTVVTGTNDEDGVARAIEKYFLGK